MKRYLSLLCLILIFSISSCSNSLSFDSVLAKCVSATGYEVYIWEKGDSEKDGCVYYFPNEKDYAQDSKTHVKRHMSVDDYIRLEEYDFKWNAKKGFKPRTDFVFADSLMFQTTDRIQELNIEDGYILEYGTVLFDDNYEGYLYARYLVGKNILSFVIFFSDGTDELKEYEIYRKICNDCGLFTSEKIDECVNHLYSNQ